MYINKLVGLKHDVFYDACDANDLFILVVMLKVNWL